MQLIKYPRTQHIHGSRFQEGDEDLDSIPFESVKGRHLVIEEKMDGANSAISFDENRKLLLQSRGHFLSGGDREKHFDLFKQWANTQASALWESLGARYIAYGEWLYAKHTIFYNRLPHYWLEFDVYDKQLQHFLSTERRRDLFRSAPVESVQVLFSGELKAENELKKLLGLSLFIEAGHLEQLAALCEAQGLSVERACKETDPSQEMEGLYIKVEEDGLVKDRFKFVRSSFLSTVVSSQSHWLERPIIANQLIPGVNLFEGL